LSAACFASAPHAIAFFEGRYSFVKPLIDNREQGYGEALVIASSALNEIYNIDDFIKTSRGLMSVQTPAERHRSRLRQFHRIADVTGVAFHRRVEHLQRARPARSLLRMHDGRVADVNRPIGKPSQCVPAHPTSRYQFILSEQRQSPVICAIARKTARTFRTAQVVCGKPLTHSAKINSKYRKTEKFSLQ